MPSRDREASKYWVVQQHDQIEVVQGSEPPSVVVKIGERGKRLYGPYHTKADADSAAESMTVRTLRHQTGERGR